MAAFGPINVMRALRSAPPKMEEILPGFYVGTLGMLVAPGGTGKSSWALALALSVATNTDLVGLRPRDSHAWVQGRVLSFRSFHWADENVSDRMSAIFKHLDALVRDSRTALLIVHHTAKGRSGDQAWTARGSGVLTNDVRWQGHLVEMTETEGPHWIDPATGRPINSERAHRWVRWHGAKQNYDTRHPDQWYRRDAEGVLVPIRLSPAKSKAPIVALAEKSPRGRGLKEVAHASQELQPLDADLPANPSGFPGRPGETIL